MVYNASAAILAKKFGYSPYYFLKRHLCYTILALCFLISAMKSPFPIWKKWAPLLILMSLVSLFLVFVPQIGITSGGAKRWIKIAPFLSFQPSEMAKISIVIFMASFLSKKSQQLEEFRSISTPLFFVLILFFAIIVAQNDLGTGTLMIIVCFTMLFAAGVSLKHLMMPIMCFMVCLIFLIIAAPYRLSRIFAFMDPWADPRGSGYQIIRSLVALGSGGKSGLGLGTSVQNGISIPAAFTDFIFAIIGKEAGLIGTSLIVCLFFIISWRGLRIARNCKDLFGQYLSIGLTCLICYQGIINMGVVTGLLPTKGITLPFISYGGSSLIFNALSIGILLNVSQYT